MTPLQWKRPHHPRWLLACLAALIFASLAGGFSLGLAAIVAVIFAVGARLLSFDGLGAPPSQPEPADVTPSDDQALA